MTQELAAHSRALAKQCRLEANWLLGGCITGVIVAWVCVFTGRVPWAIAFACISFMQGFINATLRRDADALDHLADRYTRRLSPPPNHGHTR